MDDNDKKIISFEEYRMKKLGDRYQKDVFSELFSRDLKEQTGLLEWYLFHHTFNKHRLFVYSLFYQNRMHWVQNLNSGFVACFSEHQMKASIDAILQALHTLGAYRNIPECSYVTLSS